MLLLIDLFEKFRATCLEHYSYTLHNSRSRLGCSSQNVTCPLKLITYIDMYHFIENSIRGGVSMITTRYARAIAPTLPAYDASHPNVNLIYLDANSLYGCAMFQPLLAYGFRFLQPDEIEALAVEVWELPMMMKMDTYLRWILAVHNIYTTLTTTTHSPPSRWSLVVICIHPLSRQSLHRLHLQTTTHS